MGEQDANHSKRGVEKAEGDRAALLEALRPIVRYAPFSALFCVGLSVVLIAAEGGATAANVSLLFLGAAAVVVPRLLPHIQSLSAGGVEVNLARQERQDAERARDEADAARKAAQHAARRAREAEEVAQFYHDLHAALDATVWAMEAKHGRRPQIMLHACAEGLLRLAAKPEGMELAEFATAAGLETLVSSKDAPDTLSVCGAFVSILALSGIVGFRVPSSGLAAIVASQRVSLTPAQRATIVRALKHYIPMMQRLKDWSPEDGQTGEATGNKQT